MNGKKFSDLQKMSPAELLREIQERRETKTKNLVAHNEYEHFLIGLWSEFFTDADFDTHTDFFSLGGTSLQAVLMLSKINNQYHIEFDLLELFQATTIESQAKLIENTLHHRNVTPQIYSYHEDLNLIEHIDFNDITPTENKIKNILLTGASGFLGLHLLKEFLVNTDANIICILRGNSVEEATNRLLERAQDNRISISDSDKKRIRCFCGDMSQQQLGLLENDYNCISKEVDLIVHSAAVVNFVFTYEQLRQSNVLGLIELMKIAINYKLKPIHLISTIGVFSNQFASLNEINEFTELKDSAHLNGYFQSKWVNEKISSLARDKGLTISIYRPSGITMNSKSGVISSDDLTYQLMKLSVKLGAFADLNSIIDVLPVDYVAKSISYLITHYPHASNTYHITSDEVLNSKELIKQLPRFSAIKILSFDDFLKQAIDLVNTTEDQQLLKLGPLIISGIMQNSYNSGKLPKFNSEFTDSLLHIKNKPLIRETLLSIVKRVATSL